MALKIEIYSDVICPWCFLGKRRLEKALNSLPIPPDVEIHYLPYELDPSIPPEGVDRQKRLESKYGRPVGDMDRHLKALGQKEEIAFNFDLVRRTPNTLNAHRLIWLAGKEGIQIRMAEALFSAYFTEGKDLGDRKVLAETAATAGLDRGKAEKLLSGEEGIREVREMEERAYDMGLSGVPHFVIGGLSHISGAQPVETFALVLAEAQKSSHGILDQK